MKLFKIYKEYGIGIAFQIINLHDDDIYLLPALTFNFMEGIAFGFGIKFLVFEIGLLFGKRKVS